MFNGKIHYKWPFSIATLNYQRVCKLTPYCLRALPPGGMTLDLFVFVEGLGAVATYAPPVIG
jgi:hypothetical protein